MKNLLLRSLFLLGLITLCNNCFAQKKNQTKWELHAGVGLLPTFVKDKSKVQLLPLQLNLDYRVSEKISLGLLGGYSVTQTDQDILGDTNTAQWRTKYAAYGLRLAAHTNKIEDWDIYGGILIGYSSTRVEILEGDEELVFENKGLKENSGKFLGSAFIGARYDIANQIGIFAELGFAVSLINMGVSYRF